MSLRPCFFLCFCLGFLSLGRAFADGLPVWNGPAQGKFIRCVAADARGRLWIGTESDGVWTASPADPDKGWTRYGLSDGMGEDTTTALAGDPKGRVWAGHLSHGLSVFNGSAWKTYDMTSGPVGGHVFALAVSPKDGDVWVGTDAGLTRYSQSKDDWRSVTRTDGLPSDQISALAFDKSGTLYVGTQCDGLAVGTPADDYAAWRHVPGPIRTPASAGGAGLPSGRINALLVTHDGTIYAGTPSGLAGSQDGGRTWKYGRGGDWLAKAQGAAGAVPADPGEAAPGALTEDYVTALGEDAAGRLWIGHRARGLEVLDPATLLPVALPGSPHPYADYVTCLLPSAGPSVLIGGCGAGLSLYSTPDAAASAWPMREGFAPAPFPSPAAPPTVSELKALTAAVLQAVPPLKPGEGAYLGDDWQTQGDWFGRYGRQRTLLSGIRDSEVMEAGYEVSVHVGPHHKEPAGPYSYMPALATSDRRFPYSPSLGHRREAELNDGSWDTGKYATTYDGPDLWVTFQVPAGPHRASFYFVNGDGHQGSNRWRDYLLELKGDAPTPEAEEAAPTLASARVAEFYGGVYKRFLVQGPGTFHLKIGRSYSFCTKLQGVFLDRLADTPTAAPPAPSLAVAPAAPPSDAKPFLGAVVAPRAGKDGLDVVLILAGSSGAEAGLTAGDVLLSANGLPLPDPPALFALLATQHVGDTLHLRIRRGAGEQALDVVLRADSGPVRDPSNEDARPLSPAALAYAPPAAPAPDAAESDLLSAARALWSALDGALARSGGAARQTPGRVLAYRAALAAHAPPALLENWRWALPLWTNADRQGFDAVTSQSAGAKRN